MKNLLLKSMMLLSLLMVGMGAWADEVVSYTLSFTKNGSNTAYSTYYDITVGNIGWKAPGNQALGNYIKMGGKLSSATNLYVYSKNAISDDITKVVLNHGSKDSQITVNSVTLKVYSTAADAASDANAIESVSGTYVDNGNTTITKESGNDWSGKFYRIVYNLSSSASSKNYGIIFNSATFYTESATTDPVDASWSVSPAEITVVTGKNATATVTTNYDGDLIAETNNANVATCSFEDGVLTVTGVSAGTTTITFLGDETSKYNEIEKEVTVTVTDPAVFDPSNFVIGDFVEDIPAAVDGNITFNLGDYSFEVKKNTGGTAPTVHGTALDMRIYAKGTITISSATKQFDGVVFNISEQGLKRLAPITADCGTVATQTSGDETVTWTSTTPVSSVTFTVGDNANYGSDGSSKAGQLDFVSLSINEVEVPTTATITLNAACTDGDFVYGTYSNTSNWVVPSDLVVYEVCVVDGELAVFDYNEDDVVPANAGVMVAAENGGNYTVNLTTDAATASPSGGVNSLVGTGDGVTAAEMAQANTEFFRLTMHNGETIGFFWGAEDGAAFALGANKAYLAVSTDNLGLGGSAKGLWFNHDVDGINNVNANANSNVIYNLAGQRVNANAKGIVIVNGKKYLNK